MNNANKRKLFDSIVWSASLLFAFGLLISEASAESTGFSATNKTWSTECGSCHLAYPPDMLPAPAWRRMLSGLDQHFGTDASVDARAAAEIGAFLERNAGQGRKRGSDSGTLRITETRWFVRKHDEVPTTAWKNPRVKTPANCGACHSAAERGDFDEDAVRIPR
ncbi:MAG: diheme cytochrome c [Burkholderiales bacterium]|nr:diheme cytochrome c [Burkholderiales bacterium]